LNINLNINNENQDYKIGKSGQYVGEGTSKGGRVKEGD
jgi:hypothetical protein